MHGHSRILSDEFVAEVKPKLTNTSLRGAQNVRRGNLKITKKGA